MDLILVSTSPSSSSETRSILLSMMRSAKANCSTASFSTPSGFSSSTCWTMCLASTTVMMPSSLYRSVIFSSTKNVCATGAGSAKPVVSMRTPSKSLMRSCMRSSTSVKSPRTVQQMHPFMTSMMLSSELSTRMFSSTPTSPNSFSMTANFILCSVLVKI